MLRQSYHLQITHTNEAMTLAKKALRQSESLKYAKGIADASMRIGYMLFIKGSNDQALGYLQLAYDKRIDLTDFDGAIGTASVLSYVYKAKGKKDSAFLMLFNALKINDKNYNALNNADIAMDIGNLYAFYNDHIHSVNYTGKAANIYAKLNHKEGLALTWSSIGISFYNLNKFRTALSYFSKSDSLLNILGDKLAIARNQMNLALCYSSLGNLKLSEWYYNKVINNYTQLGMTRDLSLAYNNLALLYLKENKLNIAKSYLTKSLNLSTSHDYLEIKVKSLKHLSKVYELENNFGQALYYQSQFLRLSDTLLNTEKTRQIAEMQTQYETEKKEKENLRLQMANKTKSQQRNFFIISSLSLLLVLGFLYNTYLQKQKLAKTNEHIARQKITTLINEQEINTYNAMLEGQEEERKRIATDLHDRIGSILSTVKLMFSSMENKIDLAFDENKNQFVKTNDLLDEAVVEVRRISHDLHTGTVASFGLTTALQELCLTINQSKIVACKLNLYGDNERMSPQIELGIYRMVQEVFSNILKHSKATKVSLSYNKTEEYINLTIEDDGVGFDLNDISKKDGIGLSNLRARAEILKGTYHIDSQINQGTISIIEIPLS